MAFFAGAAVPLCSFSHHHKLIAYELGLAASTVRVLFFRAMRKLGAANRSEAKPPRTRR